MNLTQLTALLAVSEHQSFTAAATALHTVQSNVSTHVARLERELGVTLIDRSTYELTVEGCVVADRGQRVLEECNAIRTHIPSSSSFEGPSHVGMISTVARWLAPALMGTISTRYPEVHLVISEATSAVLVDKLLAEQIETAVLSTPGWAGVTLVPLFDEELLLVIPPGHALAGCRSTDIPTLCSLDLLLPPPKTAYRPELDTAAAAHDLVLQPKAEFDGVQLLAALTIDGHGASILPATAIPASLWACGRVIFVDGLATRTVSLAARIGAGRRNVTRSVTKILHDLLVAVARQTDGVHIR